MTLFICDNWNNAKEWCMSIRTCICKFILVFFFTAARSEGINSNLWEAIQNAPSGTLTKRIDYYSSYFLGTLYGSIDYQKPIEVDSLEKIEKYLFEPEFKSVFTKFDCVTFVETVLALALTRNENYTLNKFEDLFSKYLKSIRYVDSKDAYIYRNHFQSIDWNINNSWLVKDITDTFPINYYVAKCEINRLGWLFNNVSLKKFLIDQDKNNSNKEAVKLILQKYKVKFPTVKSELKYLSIKELIDNKDTIHSYFPDVTIVNCWSKVKMSGLER
jgi:hypothetical protein